MLPLGNRSPQTLQQNGEPSKLDQTRGVVKQFSIYAAIAAVIAAIGSGSFLVSDNKDNVKKGEKLARVYVILEVAVIIGTVAFVALTVGPYVLDKLKRM